MTYLFWGCENGISSLGVGILKTIEKWDLNKTKQMVMGFVYSLDWENKIRSPFQDPLWELVLAEDVIIEKILGNYASHVLSLLDSNKIQ